MMAACYPKLGPMGGMIQAPSPDQPELKTTNALRPHEWIRFLVGMLKGHMGCMSQAPSHYWPEHAYHPMNMCSMSCVAVVTGHHSKLNIPERGM